MKELTITDRLLGDCGLLDFERFEKEFDVQLPEYLRTFILKYNGTHIDKNWFKSKISFYLEFMLPLYSDVNPSMAKAIVDIRYDEGDEMSLGRYDVIPFAFTMKGYVCVSIGNADNGIVYLTTWSEEEEKVILLKIADSLEAFIDNLDIDVEELIENMYTTGVTQIGYWLTTYILNKDYKEGIRAIKLAAHFQENFECIKLCLKDNRWGYIDSPLPIFAQFGVNLKENTVTEAYKWVELLVQNLEVEDESQIIEYPLIRTEQETAVFHGVRCAFGFIQTYFYSQSYKEAIKAIKIYLSKPYDKIQWNSLKKAVSERCFDAYKDSDLDVWKDALTIFRKARVRLREDTEAEAYKWLELLIRNVELEDESQIIEYPLIKENW